MIAKYRECSRGCNARSPASWVRHGHCELVCGLVHNSQRPLTGLVGETTPRGKTAHRRGHGVVTPEVMKRLGQDEGMVSFPYVDRHLRCPRDDVPGDGSLLSRPADVRENSRRAGMHT
jgi:hypothetical protein